jgi:Mg-chelatase subunit ChlD
METLNVSLRWRSSDIHPLIRSPVISVMILDCSESMRRHEQPALGALNGALTRIRKERFAHRAYLAAIGFGSDAYTLVPLTRSRNVQRVREIPYSRGTRLYETCCETLLACFALCDALAREHREPSCRISLVSDGLDNLSHPRYERRLRHLAAEAQERGCDLRSYALGISGTKLAGLTGFPLETCRELVPSPETIGWTMSRWLRFE